MKTYFEMIRPLATEKVSPVFRGCIEDLEQFLNVKEGKFFVFLWRSGAKCIEVNRVYPRINPQLLDIADTIIIAYQGKIRLVNKDSFTKKYAQ